MGIVGFSYEVTNSTSTEPWITKREFGRKTSQKVILVHGYNRRLFQKTCPRIRKIEIFD